MFQIDHFTSNCYLKTLGFSPYQTVVLWYPSSTVITAVIMVAILRVGQMDINSSSKTCPVKSAFPQALSLFSTGILLGSWRGSG